MKNDPHDRFSKLNINSSTAALSKSASKKGVKKQALDFTGGPSGASSYTNPYGGGGTFFTRPIDYKPEFASPDRYLLPKDIKQLNDYWRMFYKIDPVAGSVVDIYCEMPLSDYDITGQGVEGSIHDDLMTMSENINLLKLLNSIMVEFLVTGESIPHMYYDSSEKMWGGWGFHKGEEIEVVDSHFFGIEPFLVLKPSSEEIKQITKIKKLSEQLNIPIEGNQFMNQLLTKKEVALEPLNVTFIPRLLHAYDNRGSSLFNRLWRIFLFEDAVFNACFRKGTLVTMHDYTVKNIEEIEKGEKVLDRRGKVQIVQNAWSEKPAKDLVRITIAGSQFFDCTENHKFPVLRNNKIDCKKYGNEQFTGRLAPNYNRYQKVEAQYIQKGDYLMFPRYFEEKQPDNVTKNMARLLGYYVAEAIAIKLSKSGNLGIGWAFGGNIENKKWVDDVQIICKNLNIETVKYDHGNRNKYDYMEKWLLEHGGQFSRTKRLSKQVMQWPLTLKKELIKGLYRGNGCNPEKLSTCGYATKSQNLIYQIRTILIQLGIFSSAPSKDKNDLYTIYSGGEHGRQLAKLIWNNNVILKRRKTEHFWVDDEYIYVRVKDIKKIKTKDLVYNLTVSGDHSYQVGGCGTFNTIQTAKRHAAPVKTVSMGDLTSNYIPSNEQMTALLQKLAQSELDPHAWIAVLPGTKFEAWGTTDKIMGLKYEYDTIERIKLMALGVSKDFISGSQTFASAQAGLQVFLSRLLSFRLFVEEIFVNPKLFAPIVKVNKWSIPTKAEVDHKIKTEDRRQEVKPRITWSKQLRPKYNKDLLDVYKMLVDTFDFKISKRTIARAADVDWEDEVRTSIEEEAIPPILTKPVDNKGEESSDFDFSTDMGESSSEAPSEEINEEGETLEEIAPEEQVNETAEETTMHASSKKEIDYKEKGDKKEKFLVGTYMKRKGVNINGDEVGKRLGKQFLDVNLPSKKRSKEEKEVRIKKHKDRRRR